MLIPCTTQLSASDVKHRLQSSGAKCIIVDGPAVDKVESVRHASTLDYLLYIGM